MRRKYTTGILRSLLALSVFAAISGHTHLGGASGQKLPEGRTFLPSVYLALGDSTGAGVGSSNASGYAHRLFIRIKQSRPGSLLVNRCHNGATTQDLLQHQMKDLSNIHPTLITVGVGANDLIRGVKPEDFGRNYENILHRLKGQTKAEIILMNIPDLSLAPAVPSYMRETARRHIIGFNKQIEMIAGRHNVVVVDLYTMTSEFSTHPKFFSEDGIHPSDTGYEFWAEAIWLTVQAALNKQDCRYSSSL
jgi:acyl-CoA thioesterase-1